MKRFFRLLWPVFAGLLLGGAVIGFLSWQLSRATERLKAELNERNAPKPIAAPLASVLPSNDLNVLPSSDRALVELRRGDVAALQADWKTAEEAYRASVDAQGGVTAERKLAWAQMQRRKFDEARSTIAHLKQEGMRREDASLLEALILLRMHQIPEAKNLITTSDESPQKHYAQALYAVITGDHDTAKKELKTVVGGWDPDLRDRAQVLQGAYDEFAVFPQSTPEHLTTLLARALAGVQECELALPLLEGVLAKEGDYRDAWIVQGFCQLTTERPDNALVSLERAYSLDPENQAVQYFLGRAYAVLGDHQNAITFLQYSIKNGLSPATQARRVLAKEAQAVGNPLLALEQLLALARASDSTIDDVTAYVTVALAAGQGTDASDVARMAVGRWPQDATAQELLGLAAKATGNRDEAKKAFEAALKIDPTREASKKGLEGL